MRNVMITTIGEDYVVAAQAKGLSNRRVIFTYAARNALLPQLQGFGLALGFVVSGALVMEIVFSYPGIGLLLLNAVTSNDYPLMQAIFLVITFAVLIANLIVDLVIVLFDPRVRARGTGAMSCLINFWRQLPLRAKVGAVAARVVHPRGRSSARWWPRTTRRTRTRRRACRCRRRRRSTCSAPRRPARTCSPSSCPASG